MVRPGVADIRASRSRNTRVTRPGVYYAIDSAARDVGQSRAVSGRDRFRSRLLIESSYRSWETARRTRVTRMDRAAISSERVSSELRSVRT